MRLLVLCAGAVAMPALARATEPFDLEVVAQHAPAALHQLEWATVPLSLENAGTTRWDPSRSFFVSYHWLTPDGKTIAWDGVRTPLPRIVRPGETVDVRAKLRAPGTIGPALLQWDVVEESVTWVSQKDPTPPHAVRVNILPATFTHAFTILEQHTPHVMWTRQQQQFHIVVRNDGTREWGPDGQINFAYHFFSRNSKKTIFDGLRTLIPRPVRTGGTIALDVPVEAPPHAGIYRLQWDMVDEGVAWFTERDPSPEPEHLVIVVPALPSGAPAAALVALLLLVIAIVALRRANAPAWLIATASVGDVLWMGAALALKQSAVLSEVQNLPPGESPWIMISGVVALMIVVALLPRRVRPWIAILINAIASVVILADVVHLRFFGDVISVASIRSARQVGSVGESIRSLLAARDVWLLLDLIPGIGIAYGASRLLRREPSPSSRRFAIALVPLLIPGALTLWQLTHAGHGTLEQGFQNTFVVRDIGLLDYHVRDLWHEAGSRLFAHDLSPARKAEIERWFVAHASERAGVGPSFGVARGKNVVMIQVESMQAFAAGMDVAGQPVTPNIDRWRSSGALWFPGCSDQTAQGRTSDGEFATQVSLLPLSQGAVAFRYGDNHYEAIGDILESHGYQTFSTVAFNGAFWNRLVTHPQYGYAINLYDAAFAPGPRVGWGLNDRDFLLQTVPHLEKLRKPFGAFLITLSNHHPFESFPAQLKELKLGALEGTSFGNYLHAMHWFDRAFGEFMEALRRDGLLDQTVVVLWGDHSAGFPWDESFARSVGHHATEPEYYAVAKVPVMFIVPGATAELRSRRDMPCGQTDVAPTLLALLGFDPAAYPLVGRNLAGNPGIGPVVQRYGVWDDSNFLYLPKGATLEEGLCFDVKTLVRLPVSRCAAGNLAAQSELEVSRDVIENDLQVPLTRALQQRTR